MKQWKQVTAMMQNSEKYWKGGRQRRRRNRVASCLSGSRGRAIGFSSLAAPIAGYIVNDLRKPDSIIRRLIGTAVARLRLSANRTTKELDIGNQAEVIVHDDKSGA
jgi:hypothetical protein